MNTKTGFLGLMLVGVVAAAAACSSSTESNDGGSSGAAGKGTGGKSSAAGSTSTSGTKNDSGGASDTGGTRNNTGGTNAGGGTRNNGGAANTGGFNFGGEGFDPDDYACNPVPQTGATCAAGTQPCVDGSKVCYCQAQKWACTDVLGGEGGAGPGGGFGDLECPPAKPGDGTACGDTLGFCPYGGGQFMGCACAGGTWRCSQ